MPTPLRITSFEPHAPESPPALGIASFEPEPAPQTLRTLSVGGRPYITGAFTPDELDVIGQSPVAQATVPSERRPPAPPTPMILPSRPRTRGDMALPVEGNDAAFTAWYAMMAQRYGLDPNPDSPEQKYDYRAAFQAGVAPDASGHWPSTFKRPGHPNEIVGGFNTRTGERVPGTTQASEAELIQLGWDAATAARLSQGATRPHRPTPTDRETAAVDRVRDVGITALRGAIAVPVAAVGILDLPTGGRVGRALETAGFRPSEAQDILSTFYSPAQQEAFSSVSRAPGALAKAKAALTHPSVIGHAVLESAPLMLAGGAIGRGLTTVLPRVSAVAGAAAGEGAVSAGLTAEQARSATGTLTPKQAGAATVSGVATGGLALVGGAIAKRLGIADVDTLLVAGAQSAPARHGLVKSVIYGAVTEGVLEELPQSVQEQVIQNAASGRSLATGVDEAAVMGLLVGAVMGGGAQAGRSAPVVAAPAPTLSGRLAVTEASAAPSVVGPPPMSAPLVAPVESVASVGPLTQAERNAVAVAEAAQDTPVTRDLAARDAGRALERRIIAGVSPTGTDRRLVDAVPVDLSPPPTQRETHTLAVQVPAGSRYEDEVIHVTTPDSVKDIRATGFDVNRGKGLGGDHYGPGVYLADYQRDMASFWRSELETKNFEGIVDTAAMKGRVVLDHAFRYEYTKYSNSGNVIGRVSPRQALQAQRPDLVSAYDAIRAEPGQSDRRAFGHVLRQAGFDGLVIEHRAGDEIVAFDAKSVVWDDPVLAPTTPADHVTVPIATDATSVDISPPPAQRETHTFSSTQVNLPPALATPIRDMALAIPDDELAPNGRAGDTAATVPHITVKYGLDTTDVEEVRRALADEPPVHVTLGTTSFFPNSESDNGDVVTVAVDSPDLKRLNTKLAAALETTETHPDYTPHVTVAYVKPGRGRAYAGSEALKGQTATLDRVQFSTKDGRILEIPLTGQREVRGAVEARVVERGNLGEYQGAGPGGVQEGPRGRHRPVPRATPAESHASASEPPPRPPWQMTRSEFKHAENLPKFTAITAAMHRGAPIVLVTNARSVKLSPENIRLTRSGTVTIPEGRRWVSLTDPQVDQLAAQAGVQATPFEEKVYHRAAVENAVRAGEDVPAEVLKDYPELANREEATSVDVQGVAAPAVVPEIQTFTGADLQILRRSPTPAIRQMAIAELERRKSAPRLPSGPEARRVEGDVSIQEGDPGPRVATSAAGTERPGGGRPGPPRGRLSRRAQADLDTIDSLVKDAITDGYTGDLTILAQALTDRAALVREIDSAVDDAGGTPEALLRAIVKAGGISLSRDGQYKGEIRWLKESPLIKRWGLFTGRGGLQLDGVVEYLQQDPRFQHIDTINELVDTLGDIAQGVTGPGRTPMSAKSLGAVGDRWYDRLVPPAVEPVTDAREPTEGGDLSFDPNVLEQPADTLETGEVQPRLPDAGAIRDVERGTPEVAAIPFSLTRDADTTVRERQATLPESNAATTSGTETLAVLDRLEDAARRRLAARGTFTGSRLSAGLPVDDLTDLVIIGAAKIARGTVQFAQWSAEMVREFGDLVRPHLDSLYQQAKAQASTLGPRPFREASDAPRAADRIPAERIHTFPSLQKMPEAIRGDIQDLLVRYQGFETQRRGVQSWAHSQEAATHLWLPLETLRPGTALNAEELEAYKTAVATALTTRQALLERMRAGEATDREKLELARLTDVATVLVASYRGAKAEAGRALNVLRSKARILDLQEARFLEAALRAPGFDRDLSAVSAAALEAAGDPLKQLRWLRERASGTWFDTLQAVYYANLLSGVKTHLRNTIGNTFNLVASTLLPLGAAPVDVLRRHPRTVFIREIPHGLVGGAIGVQHGLKNAAFTFREGFRPSTVSAAAEGMFDTPRTELPGGLRNPFNYPSRALEAADEFFRAVAFHQALYAGAYATARSEGLRTADTISARMATLLTDTTAKDSSRVFEQAQQAAARAVFQEEPGDIVKWLLKAKAPTAPLPLRVAALFLTPFLKTPSAILRQGAEWSPVGFAMKGVRQDGREGAQAGGRAALGTAFLLGPLAWLAATGRLTGAPPDDPGEREAFYAQGKLANAVRVGDYWVRYVLFQPFSVPMAAVANAWTTWQASDHDEGSAQESVAAAVAGAGASLLDQSFLSGLGTFIDAVNDPTRYAGQWLSLFSQGMVPLSGLMRNVTQAIDPVIRRPQGVRESVQAILPGRSQTLLPRRTRFGEAVRRPGGPIQRGFLVPEVSRAVSDDVTLMLARLGVTPTASRGRFTERGQVVSLTRPEQDAVSEAMGRERQFALEQLVKAPRFAQRPDEQQRILVRRALADATDSVRPRVLARVRTNRPITAADLLSPPARAQQSRDEVAGQRFLDGAPARAVAR